MGCNCGGGQKVQMAYVYTAPTGETKTYNTEIEARAAQIRNQGGDYQPVPVP